MSAEKGKKCQLLFIDVSRERYIYIGNNSKSVTQTFTLYF